MHLSRTDIARAREIAAQAPKPSPDTVARVVNIMEAAVADAEGTQEETA